MKSRFQAAYEQSPLWVQDIAVTGYGAKLIAQRYRIDYFKTRRDLRERNDRDLAAMEQVQLDRLRAFIAYARTHSAFYERLYADVDVSVVSLSDLERFPTVTKEDLRKNINDVYTVAARGSIPAFTGGTTGKSLEVRYTHQDFQQRMGYLDAFKERIGIDVFRAKKATFSGRQFTANGSDSQQHWRTNWAYRQRLYSTFDMTGRNLPSYVEDLNSYRPDVLNGFVSAIYEVAQHISQHGTKLTFQPQAIFTTSETLLPHHRELIESTFACKVYNQYASAEGAPFITECKHGSLHFEMDTGVIEVGNETGPAGALITSFTTHGTPLIRYAIGDEIVFSERSGCGCGSAFPIVDRIEGRSVDYLLRSDGAKVTLSHLADVIKGLPSNVQAMQFVQDEVEQLTVNMVVDSARFSEQDQSSVHAELAYRFGPETAIKFVFVDEIEREKSGKLALIKNRVGETK